ncbi:hypothetical protein ZWY2020_034673 [Hordeum vulgare]|nr:hypothetical protein ZWY2020_034673 [Hordeum vulgare]
MEQRPRRAAISSGRKQKPGTVPRRYCDSSSWFLQLRLIG